MNAKIPKRHFFAPIAARALFALALLALAASCASAPEGAAAASPEDLARLEQELARATAAREGAVAVSAASHFPSEWALAEADFNAGRGAERETLESVLAATASLSSAAGAFGSLAERSAPLAAARMGEAMEELDRAAERARASRQAALGAGGSERFPADWEAAEGSFRRGEEMGRGTLGEIEQAAALYASAADGFDGIASRSQAQDAARADRARQDMQAALAGAEQARGEAQAARANTHFPAEWRDAEARLRTARNAARGSDDEMRAAAAALAEIAAVYSDLAARSRPLAEIADAQRELTAAAARADRSRRSAAAAGGEAHFPADWNRAEAQNTSGRAPRSTLAEIRQGTALLGSAADGFDSIAARSEPLAARAREDANSALQAAMARAASSRQAAVAAEAQSHFPAEWRAAETQNTAAGRARRGTAEEMRAAAELFAAAAASYDDLARRSAPLAAAARNEANRDFQAAAARADRSRRAAADAGGQARFPADWNRAEGQNTAGRSAPRNTAAETRAAIAQLSSAANGFDSIAERSAPLAAREREEANSALQASMARAAASRQEAAAVEAQAHFQAEWRAAESQNTAAGRARRGTPEEMRAASALFTAAADAYDDLARRSRPLFAAERADAERSLQQAIARAGQSRQSAANTDAQANFPREWAGLETRHRNAENARRATNAEMRSAANLFSGVADGFDDIVQRNVRLAEQNEGAAIAARATAESQRQAAIDVRANLAVREDFSRAEATLQQANAAFGARSFTAALAGYNQSAGQFAAAARETERMRLLADGAVEEARQSSAASSALAISTGLALEEES